MPNTHQSKEQVDAKFRHELRALLAKYNAELQAEDHWQGYAECGEDVRMTVYVPAVFDENHNCVREWTSIDLGTFVDGKVSPNTALGKHGHQEQLCKA